MLKNALATMAATAVACISADRLNDRICTALERRELAQSDTVFECRENLTSYGRYVPHVSCAITPIVSDSLSSVQFHRNGAAVYMVRRVKRAESTGRVVWLNVVLLGDDYFVFFPPRLSNHFNGKFTRARIALQRERLEFCNPMFATSSFPKELGAPPLGFFHTGVPPTGQWQTSVPLDKDAPLFSVRQGDAWFLFKRLFEPMIAFLLSQALLNRFEGPLAYFFSLIGRRGLLRAWMPAALFGALYCALASFFVHYVPEFCKHSIGHLISMMTSSPKVPYRTEAVLDVASTALLGALGGIVALAFCKRRLGAELARAAATGRRMSTQERRKLLQRFFFGPEGKA